MMGPYGLYQHAQGIKPLLAEGYCTDDNSRAIRFLVSLEQYQPSAEANTLLNSCWQFLTQARRPNGVFRNFRQADGKWLDQIGTEDTLAHTARSLATVLLKTKTSVRRRQARDWLIALTPHLQQLHHQRAIAESIIALSLPPVKKIPASLTSAQNELAGRLLKLFASNRRTDWPWFENRLTYANALLPHALLSYVRSSNRSSHYLVALHASASFLCEATITGDMFHPIGNKGWYQSGRPAARYDQQPIEAGTMFEFLLEYHAEFPDRVSPATVAAPYLWFFGHNSLKQPLVNPEKGWCRDGLNHTQINPNCGAESMLAYLHADLLMRTAPAAIKQAAAKMQTVLPVPIADSTSPT
ncbi:MAG: hypothetical protein Q8P73_04965 [bacterium]|nr:hypothetical protein [bacterium]